ncbi:F-box/kelch-repeat protein-like protein [Tanacetum coccineum]
MECYRCPGRGYGLYYCSSEDDYKLVVVTAYGNAYIYSLKYDSWRKLDTKPPLQEYWRPGFCLNKNLYFLSRIITDGSARFDTKPKRFHKINNPPVPDDKSFCSVSTTITVPKGSIHLCAMNGYTYIELWKFIADGDIWRKVVTYQHNHDIRGLSPFHLLTNGNLLMIRYNLDGGPRICQVDLKKRKYTEEKKDGNKSKDKNKSKGNYSDFTVGWPEKVIYTETFVSPNRYTK